METILKLIPQDPKFVPDLPERQNAKNSLAVLMPHADEILEIITEEIEFVDPGENLKEIHCPSCGAALHEDWWLPAMKNASEERFTDLSITMPCCGATGSLNELHYKEAAGFARFILEAVNPESAITKEQISLLEEAIGCKLRMIIAQY